MGTHHGDRCHDMILRSTAFEMYFQRVVRMIALGIDQALVLGR